ncbi:hypothetical protein PENTCL1PPCAC_1639, partial [Pristionchus entomophagus]
SPIPIGRFTPGRSPPPPLIYPLPYAMAGIIVSDSGTASAQSSATSVISDTASSASGRRTRTHRSNLSVLIDELNREVRSNSEDNSITETRVTSGAEPKISNWTKIANVFKAIGTVCEVTCPPVPARIVRKVAFHPPPKNSGYRLQLDSEQHRFVESSKEVVGKPFTLVPTPMRGLTHRDYAHIMERITATTIKSPHGNDLVVIHVRCVLPDPCESQRKQVILMTQPNSSDLGHFLQPHCINFVQVADSIGTDVYAFDYSGFGYSTGYPSERHIYADTLAVFDHVKQTNPEQSIVLLGYSIGTAAAVDVAYRKTLATLPTTSPPPLSGMILVAPFTSAIRLLSSQPMKDSTCCLDPFANSEKISNIDLPILIVHGTDDSMVPLEHSTALAQRLRHPLAPFIVQGADHQTVFGCNPATFSRMSLFVLTETLVGKRCVVDAKSALARSVVSQPVARSVLSTRTEQSVPVVASRCPSVESVIQVTPAVTTKTRPATPIPSKANSVPARSKEAATPVKTAQVKSPTLNTATRATTPLNTAREASPVVSAYYPCHTPIELAEIETMQRKIAALE